MTLLLHDTMAREKRAFEPREGQPVTMYVCGPTVYNYAHIGNARPVVVFDVLFRLLRRLYGDEAVIYARNITDVDDKINAKAVEEGVDIKVITDRFTAYYHEQMAALGALAPTLEPRATDHISDMKRMILQLIQQGCAYEAEGHVLFDIAAYQAYGKLSGRDLDEMIAGARVEVAPYKKNAADFVLWKPSKPGEPKWPGLEGHFGPGRPGWHIECSAMIEKNLGLPIDIHGGGIDLTFPHHENELAQGVCAHGGAHDPAVEYSRYWMHNGFLDFSGEKMSKSLGNVVRPHDLLEQGIPGEVLRWALLSAHYHQPLAWSEELIVQATRSLDRLYGVLRRTADVEATHVGPSSAFLEALEDDLNTPRAFKELHALAGLLETTTGAERAAIKGELIASAHLIGFLGADPEAWFQGAADPALKARIERLIDERIAARNAKDWASADRIRAELTALNVEVMDNATGATWRIKEKA